MFAASSQSNDRHDDCSICLNALAPGSPVLALSCGHKFHLQCLASNLKAQNKQCPLCRAAIEATVTELLVGPGGIVAQQQQSVARNRLDRRDSIRNRDWPPPSTNIVPSVEDPIDEIAVQTLSTRIGSARQSVASSNSASLPLITASTTLEFGGQVSHQESNIYGLVTLKAPSVNWSLDGEASSKSRAPIDLICVVDQSRSMGGRKLSLLKQTLVYIAEQLNDLDRLAIVSFDRRAFDRSHGLKRMNQQNKEELKRAINDDLQIGGGTFIGCGLKMGIDLFTSRQTKNPLGALLLLTDGQDNRERDYSQLMQRLPEGILCHTFGYGHDYTASLLVQLAELGNGGTFTYIDEQQAVGPAFATTLGGLLTCVAQQICVNIEFDGQYQVTHAHSKYKHAPEELPSSKLTFKLNDINANENRNLIFQLYVPKVAEEQSVEMTSLDSMSQNRPLTENHNIGHVSITYIESNSGARLDTTAVPFQLVRASHLSPEYLQINYTLDLQRNRVETALALKQAMDETNYRRSLDLLKAQVEKIKQSVSAQDPFCQQLIKNLEHHYPSERDYRLSNSNAFLQHLSERGSYATPSTPSLLMYQSPHQLAQVTHFERSTLNQ